MALKKSYYLSTVFKFSLLLWIPLFFNFYCAGNTLADLAQVDTPTPTVSDTNPPSIPSGLMSSQINLSWSAASDDTSAQASLVYEICVSLVSGNCDTFTVSQTTSAGATTASVNSLDPLSTYYFSLRAVDQAGNTGSPTAEITADTDPLGVVNSPVFSPAAGVYGSAQNVTITSTSVGAAVCYSTGAPAPSMRQRRWLRNRNPVHRRCKCCSKPDAYSNCVPGRVH